MYNGFNMRQCTLVCPNRIPLLLEFNKIHMRISAYSSKKLRDLLMIDLINEKSCHN